MTKVYLAGPYSGGDPVINTRNIVDAADRLAMAGFAVYVPHLNHFWHYLHPHGWEFWIKHDLEWLPTCDYMVRLPGESPGAEIEIRLANELKIPVLTVDELLNLKPEVGNGTRTSEGSKG